MNRVSTISGQPQPGTEEEARVMHAGVVEMTYLRLMRANNH